MYDDSVCFIAAKGDFSLVLWVEEGSVSVLRSEVISEKRIGSESQVRLGRTIYTVKIAGTGKFRNEWYIGD